MTTATVPSRPANQSVGTIRFHTAGKPRNQWSSVIMSVRPNQRTEVASTTANAACPAMLCGTTWNCQANTAGTSTQVT